MKTLITFICAVLTIDHATFGATVTQAKTETLTMTSAWTKACDLITKSESEERIEYVTIIDDYLAYYVIDKKSKQVKSELGLVLDKTYLIPLYPRLHEYLRTYFEAHVQKQVVVAQTAQSTSSTKAQSQS